IWQDVIQGNGYDEIFAMDSISSGGYFLAGYSTSTTGYDKTDPTNGFWAVRLDEARNIVWDNAFGGGTGTSRCVAIKTLPGAQCLVAGYSNSGITADKSEALGGNDYWVVAVDSIGSFLWENVIGGSSEDILTDMKLTPDGGFITVGYSNSGISGDKTSASKGGYDYWVVKCNPTGGIEWQKTIGTSSDDYCRSVTLTTDGGYILAGYTPGGINGDKTQTSYGGNDYWMVKIDSDGEIIWDKGFGGTSSDLARAIVTLSDGNHVIAGYSISNANVIKSENSKGYNDYWVIKINSEGGLLWENTVGGNSDDIATCVTESLNSITVGGYSTSKLSSDKSEATYNFRADYWLVNLDTAGNRMWDKTIHGFKEDYMNAILFTSDEHYLLGGTSTSKRKYDKDEKSIYYDFWILELDRDPTICPIDPTITTDGDTLFCPGGTSTLTTYNEGMFMYQWFIDSMPVSGSNSHMLTVSTEGYYHVIISSDMCNIQSLPVYIAQVANPPANITNLDAFSDLCFDPLIQLKASVGAGYSYQWFLNGEIITGATASNFFVSDPGDYQTLVTNTFGCDSLSAPYTVTSSCRMKYDQSEIAVYPNPADKYFQIEFSQGFTGEMVTIEMFNQMGETVFATDVADLQGSVLIQPSITPDPGIYLIVIKASGKTFTASLSFVK
ncbi:MAG: T9SS type A sorting domain-containing protein, partial [Chitinophagales bacterium]